ncbi:hypothetical protein HG530_013539 [Fusarium avenaceum]|nr:hypothetical protein HG530_013539 [Fusarium avenaceum]
MLESRVTLPFGVAGGELAMVDDDASDSVLLPMSTFFNVPTLTTCARACVAVLALLRNVEPTLKALAPLLGRPLPNLPKSIAGTGGATSSPLLLPTDLTLTTVGLARIPVWAELPHDVCGNGDDSDTAKNTANNGTNIWTTAAAGDRRVRVLLTERSGTHGAVQRHGELADLVIRTFWTFELSVIVTFYTALASWDKLEG